MTKLAKNELQVGEVYKIRIKGFGVACRLDAIEKHEGYTNYYGRSSNATTRYRMTNLATRREIMVKSLAKFLGKVEKGE